MAKILFSAFSNVTWTPEKHLDSFVEGFIRSLARSGNEVLNIRTNDFVKHPITSKLIPFIDKAELQKKIKDFNPDLIITFNNSFPFEEVVSETNCPIALYVADGPDFFAFKDLISKYADRYHFFKMNENIYNTLLRSFPNINPDRFFDFGYATDFNAREVEQNINISFLGSIPNYTHQLVHYFQRKKSNALKDDFFKEFNNFKNDVFSKINVDLPDFHDHMRIETLAVFLITTKDRFFTLSALSDLGLVIKGYETICEAGMYNYELLNSYVFDLCVSIDQSENFYNQSKISMNLPNARATDGFSWRVPDILSSNSVLLSPRTNELKKLMEGYIDLPMYESPSEAREIAQKLLKDPVWRKDISLASQQMIRDKCKFEDKFKVMEDHFNINLTRNTTAAEVKELPVVNIAGLKYDSISKLRKYIAPYLSPELKMLIKRFIH
ncbi:glycosyltransferase [Runella aurantiaca]|nr:glycosyltransferase [Runella aurantiaca]